MKFFIHIILIFVLFSSCTKNFLDKSPYDTTEKNTVFSSIEGVESALMGCYSALQSPYYYGRNFILIQDVYTDNAKLAANNTGKFSSFYSLQIATNNAELEEIWKIGYQIISNCNAIIYSLKNQKFDAHKTNILLGETYALRALVYFDLVRLFAQTYTLPASSNVLHANAKGGHAGIPLILETDNADSVKNPKRSSVNEVYVQIISDFKNASELLQTQEISPYRLHTFSTYALLSKVYLTMHDYVTALEYAETVIYSNQYQLVENENYIESWSKEYTDESIFSIAMTPSDYPGTNSLGHMLSSKGYAAIAASDDVLELFETSDIRSELFSKLSEVHSNKYPGRNGIVGLDNIPIIRLSELYLIQAECYAQRAKQVSSFNFPAQQALLSIIQRANPTIFSVSETGNDLLNKIYNEYQKEFAFEGNRLFQIKRTHADMIRKDCESTTCSIIFPNYKFAFPIPRAEMLVNNSLFQNESY